VATPSDGSISLVQIQADGTAPVSSLIEDLHNPHGMALHRSDDKLYLYVAESNEVSRFLIAPGAASAGEKAVIVPNLPDSSSPELHGPDGLELKNLVIGPDNKLYVDIASSTNADPIDTMSNPVRSAIYQYDPDGGNGRIFARGIRNAEGLAFVPGTNELWGGGQRNGRYSLSFPEQLAGQRIERLRKIYYLHVDDHPPDEFIHVKDGANYGWPFANPNPDTPNGLDNLPFAPNYQTNPDWSKRHSAGRFRRPTSIFCH
jgi:glucose/arabinose dehydrogenase